jgi:predicted deacylase
LLRANAGGIAYAQTDRGDVVHEGEVLDTIADPSKADMTELTAPLTGWLLGVLENPVVYPGKPLCHLVHLDESTLRAIEGTESSD